MVVRRGHRLEISSKKSKVAANFVERQIILAHILVLNGPNLNLLGEREPAVYGAETLADIETRLSALGEQLGHTVALFQSNSESALVERIHAARSGRVDFAICNFGAFTHTSIALRDALLGTSLPFVEVHISNVWARETFRHHSYFSDIAKGCIVGLGSFGYELALRAIDQSLSSP